MPVPDPTRKRFEIEAAGCVGNSEEFDWCLICLNGISFACKSAPGISELSAAFATESVQRLRVFYFAMFGRPVACIV